MKRSCLVIFLLLQCLSLKIIAQQFTPQVKAYIKVNVPVVVITDVKLIDGTGNPAKSHQTVVFSNGKISQTGDAKKIKVPAGAQIIIGIGKTLIPGLVMLHEHMYYTIPVDNYFNIAEMPYSFPRLYLAGGVTTARTAGSIEPQTDLALKRMISEGKIIGPDLDVTAPYIEEQGYDIPALNVIKGPEDAAATVKFWAEKGCTSFKMYVHATRADMAAVIDIGTKESISCFHPPYPGH